MIYKFKYCMIVCEVVKEWYNYICKIIIYIIKLGNRNLKLLYNNVICIFKIFFCDFVVFFRVCMIN